MTPTQVQRHAPRRCPNCGTGLSGGIVKRTREVIELAPPRIEVIEHQYLERRCPACGTRCVPAPKLGGVVTGQGRIGHRLTSLLVLLPQAARLPVRTIQQVLQPLTGLHLSVGAIVAASQRVAKRAESQVATIHAAIRASPAVHLDETGWRQQGRNGFIPQNQWRQPVRAGNGDADDPDLTLWHLAIAADQSNGRLLPAAGFPLSLNSYENCSAERLRGERQIHSLRSIA